MLKKHFYLMVLSFIFFSKICLAEKVVVIPMSSSSSSGSSIAWKGMWTDSATYNKQDMVQYNGSSYIAVANHVASLSNQPPSGSWGLVAAAGLKGDTGDKGDPGPAVTTFAVCASGQSQHSGDLCYEGRCDCGDATLLSQVISPCSVTSDTGGCSASTGYCEGNFARPGSCCVCKP